MQVMKLVKVKLGEDGGTRESVQGGVSKWEKMTVLYSDFIEPLIVDTGAKASGLLFDKEKSGSSRG